MIINPFIIVFLTPFSIYDGLRHVLWFIPYLCIIPSLVIYYLIKNFSFLKVKIVSGILVTFIFYFLYNFLILTPYQYTYFNFLAGKKADLIEKFENDYWGSSTKELIKKIDFDKNTQFTYSVCGINRSIVEIYLKKEGFLNSTMSSPDKSEFIFMTNRAVIKTEGDLYESKNVSNCYLKYKGNNIFTVNRNDVALSILRKIN